MALVAMGVPPDFLMRPVLATEAPALASRKTLVCIFQRGAVDGLSMVVPFGEPAYYEQRTSIAIPAPTRRGGAALPQRQAHGSGAILQWPAARPVDMRESEAPVYLGGTTKGKNIISWMQVNIGSTHELYLCILFIKQTGQQERYLRDVSDQYKDYYANQ